VQLCRCPPALWESADVGEVRKCAVSVDAVDTHSAEAGIESEQELTIPADTHIEIGGSCWFCGNDGTANRSKRAIRRYSEARNSRGCRVIDVNKLTVRCNGIPAVRIAESGYALTDGLNGAIWLNLVR
jgi:hypothetical protein